MNQGRCQSHEGFHEVHPSCAFWKAEPSICPNCVGDTRICPNCHRGPKSPESPTLKSVGSDLEARIFADLDEAELKAIDALSRYKFQMFGYWAAIWVHLNRVSGANRKNPFASFVKAARILRVESMIAKVTA